ncbi:Lipoprotein signal peptidase [bioreactor metagenome]|uniref:Lipoprotein signal peptidase n=1 Tax=bioreactor metagenome TaxID=1076179 RepID=A0A645EIY1_9ZZZZ
MIFTIIFIDYFSKFAIRKNIRLNESRELIKDKLYLCRTENTGITYNMLSGRKKLIIFLNSVFIAYISILFKKFKNPCLRIGLSMVLGGALGNILDRIKNNSITDFVYIKHRKAPVFNVSDMFIAIGSVISGIFLFINME